MVRVFVTGATGVLGRATVPLLRERGHHVVTLSRSDKHDAAIPALGAEPVRADLFDPASLRLAMAGADAVLHLAIRIPPTTQARRRVAWADNDRIRAEGTRNLVDAAIEADVAVVVYPSVTFVYADGGDRWLDARTADLQPLDHLHSTLAAEAEVRRFTELNPSHRGVSLRLALLYGPDAPSTAEQLRLATRGLTFLAKPRHSYTSWLWVGGAASALVAALERAPSATYDVADDEPLRNDDLNAALAASVGRRRLYSLPAAAVPLLGGNPAETLLRSHRISNRRFKDATGWEPSVPNARVGLRRLPLPGRSAPNACQTWLRPVIAALTISALAAGTWQMARRARAATASSASATTG